jgi:hypothetical protein
VRAECMGVRRGVAVCVRCDMCACLRLWCRVAMCSLHSNDIGPEGATAISRGLVSVPQLQTLQYVLWCVCIGGAVAAAGPCGAERAGLGASVRAECVGVQRGVAV